MAASEVRLARLFVAPGTGAAQEAQISVRQARVAMSQRDVALAADHYRRARNIAEELTNPSLVRFHGDYALVLARLNRPDAAWEVVEELRLLGESFPSSWTSRSIALCEAMLTPGEEGLQAFSELLDAWDGEHHEYLRARAMFAYADALRQCGYKLESERTRRIAAEVFREVGIALGDATCVSADADVESSSVLELLTEKELDVVRLLARGAKNQAIAHELFVSVRTVELRLTGIYRKVGVKSRFDLMKRVMPELEARDGPAPGPPSPPSRPQR